MDAHDPTELAAASRRLAAILGAPQNGATPLAFAPLPASPPPRRVAAVDGSHAVLLDGKSFVVGAFRATFVLAEGTKRVATPAPRTRFAFLAKGEAGDVVNAALKSIEAAPVATPDRDPTSALEDLRALAEVEAAFAALGALEAGDALVLDGAFEPHAPAPPRDLLVRLREAAAAKGVALLAIAKSTSVTIDGTPALHAVGRRARREAPSRTWIAPLPTGRPDAVARSYVARLNPAQERLFRFDVASAGPRIGARGEDEASAPLDSDARAIAALAPLATHPGYPGYPIALALAHNAVALDEAAVEDLAFSIRRGALRLGVEEDAWDAFFDDFHDELDRGA